MATTTAKKVPAKKAPAKKAAPSKAKSAKAASKPKAMSKPKSQGLGVTGFARTILYQRDWNAGLAFYRDVLGLRLAYPAEEGWAEFDVAGTALCLHGGRTSEGNTDGLCSVSLTVSDLDGACAALEARGLSVTDPASPCAGLRYASFHDPSGNVLSFEGR